MSDPVLELLDENGQRLQSCYGPQYSSPCLSDDYAPGNHNFDLELQTPGAAGVPTTFYAHVFDWRGDARPDMVYGLHVNGVTQPLSFGPASLGLGATRGVNYQKQFVASGGTGTATFTTSSGALPPGWSLSASGVLGGEATTTGIYTFSVRATDSATSPQIAERSFTLQIAEPLVITSSMDVTVCAYKSFALRLETTGGLPPTRWSYSFQRWRAGIELEADTGFLIGYAGQPDDFLGFVGVGDSADPPSGQGGQFALHIADCP
jgi:hypothetical protein